MKFTKETFNPKLSPEEQFIVTMIALSGMILCVIAMAIYLSVAVADNWTFRTLIIVNAFFGVLFLGANLLGIYQQFQIMKAGSGLQDMLTELTNMNVGNAQDIPKLLSKNQKEAQE